MEKAKVLSVEYEPSDSIEVQGNRKKIEKYLKAGYYIKESRNGYWVLVKTARVSVTLANDSLTKEFNMKEDVCGFYGKERISQSIVDKFSKDINDEKISIFMDSNGNYEFK